MGDKNVFPIKSLRLEPNSSQGRIYGKLFLELEIYINFSQGTPQDTYAGVDFMQITPR